MHKWTTLNKINLLTLFRLFCCCCYFLMIIVHSHIHISSSTGYKWRLCFFFTCCLEEFCITLISDLQGDATHHEHNRSIGHFQAFLVHHGTQRSSNGLCFWAYPRISAWKSSFCPRRPRVHWALPNRDCVTPGNFWFCFVHRSRRIPSSGTHLTRLPLLGCPPLNSYSGLNLPGHMGNTAEQGSLFL